MLTSAKDTFISGSQLRGANGILQHHWREKLHSTEDQGRPSVVCQNACTQVNYKGRKSDVVILLVHLSFSSKISAISERPVTL